MENENYQILSNTDMNEINIIPDYANKEEKKKKELLDNSSAKDSDSNKIDASYVFIRKSFDEEKKNGDKIYSSSESLSKGFKLVDEIAKREKIFLNVPCKKDKQIKKLLFKDILINVIKLNKEARKRFKLKLPKRKSKREDKER